jgi:serine/threonine protein kinase
LLSKMEIPGYNISGELGAGGMATVYLAVQENLHREVALKVMTPGLAVDETYCERFLKEGRITAQLSHSNLLTVYDIGVYENHYYMATEYLPGGTVREKMNAGITVEEIVKVVVDIGHGLQYAHGKGFVHRDVKPGNFMYRSNGDCVLGDFGIAKAVDSNTGSTKLGTSIGTPHYMSPEQAKGERVDHRSDLYSLGVVFFELLAGKPPFDADDPFSVALMQISEPAPLLPTEHKKFDPLIQRLMSKDRNERYNQADEFIEDLEAVVGGAKIKSGSKPRKEKSPRPSDPNTETVRSPKLESEGGPKLTRLLMYGSIFAVLVAASYVGWTKFSTSSDKAEVSGQQQTADTGSNPADRPATDTIADQLDLAKSMVDAGRLLQPEGNNALEVYDDLLKVNPGNQVVLSAKRQLAKKLEQNAEVAWVTGDPEQAIDMLNNAIAVFPVDQALRRLLQQIQQAENAGDTAADTLVEEPVPTPVAPTQSSGSQREIDDLNTRGDRFFDANIFSHPPGENATDVYQQVLALEPGNQHAVGRLDQIAGTWANAAVTNLKRGKLRIAARMVDKGLQASPSNAELLALQKQIAEQGN